MTGSAADRRAASLAVAAAGVTVGFQLAGKATRDALFLSTFGVAALPLMLISAAVVSAALTIALTRVMSRTGPGRLVPQLFALSGGLLLVEWTLAGPMRPLAAILVYLHFSGLGALLVSGFWAMVNERFDPRTARAAFGRITTGASLGGLLGGLLPERVGAHLSVIAMLPFLAALHFLAAWLALGLRTGTTPRVGTEPVASTAEQTRSAREAFVASPYLQGIALLVALTAMAEGLLDYVFKASATHVVTDGAALLRLFAAFYTGTALLTIGLQLAFLRPLLARLGIARSAGLLPAGVSAAALGGLLVPGLGSLIAARATEVVLRNSVFRAAYELLFTPVSPREKRATKLLLDVGAARVGDIAAGALVQAALLLNLAAMAPLLGVTIALSLGALWVAARLHRGYVGALERSLEQRAGMLPTEDDDAGTLLQSFGAFDLTELRQRHAEPQTSPASQAVLTSAAQAQDPLEPRRRALADADPAVVRRALAIGALPGELAELVIALLAWDAVAPDAIQSLRTLPDADTAKLLSHLLNAAEDFAIRRRLVPVLADRATADAAAGLLEALDDERFEVRYRAGRALTRLAPRLPAMRMDRARIVSVILREVAVGRGVWESRQLIDEADDDWSPMEADVLRDRATRSLEHVFTLLALILPREPLRLAFHGLHTADSYLRGTALEYLETVLPEPVREKLWPFLESEPRPAGRRRTSDQVLQELLASRESIVLALAAVRRDSGKTPR